MVFMGSSGDWGRIVRIGDSEENYMYYVINDYKEGAKFYHAFAMDWFNKSWYKVDITKRFLIYPEKDGVKDVVEKDRSDFGKSFAEVEKDDYLGEIRIFE